MNRLMIVLFSFSITLNIFAQDVITTDLISYTGSIIDNLPTAKANDDYIEPTSDQLNVFGEVIELMIDKDYAGANQRATDIGYKVIELIDNSGTENKTYYMLKNNGGNHWGVYLFNPNPGREKLVIQCPHPKYDSRTGNQGIFVYRNTDAYAFYLAGTHRCNSSYYSPCSGTTSACSSTYESYRKSDQAHNVTSTFQKATEVFESKIDSLIYFQFHGFSKGSSDPYIIMSNGNSSLPEYPDYLTLLSEELLNIDPYLTFKIAHKDLDWTRLIATTNVQGRLINGSSDPCSNNATKNTGRFIHLEQEYDRLRKYQSGWQKMVDAIKNIFPSSISTDIEDLNDVPTEIALNNYPNPFNSSTVIRYSIPEAGNVSLIVYDMLGRVVDVLVNANINAGDYQISFNNEQLTSGIYLSVLKVNEFRKISKMLLLK